MMYLKGIPSIVNETLFCLIRELKTLHPSGFSVFAHGSLALEDFSPKVSDIDILVLIEEPLSDKLADDCLFLRQRLMAMYPDMPYFLRLEGLIVHQEDFFSSLNGRAVYWGTTKQRVTQNLEVDVFSRWILATRGICIVGDNLLLGYEVPPYKALVSAIHGVLEAIVVHAQITDASIYSAGWMLDIARCLYTLEKGGVTSKTKAALWVLEQGLAPEPLVLQRVLHVRRNPEVLVEEETRRWLCSLGPVIQRFACVLDDLLRRKGEPYGEIKN